MTAMENCTESVQGVERTQEKMGKHGVAKTGTVTAFDVVLVELSLKAEI